MHHALSLAFFRVVFFYFFIFVFFSNSYIHDTYPHDFFCVVFNLDDLRWRKRIDTCHMHSSRMPTRLNPPQRTSQSHRRTRQRSPRERKPLPMRTRLMQIPRYNQRKPPRTSPTATRTRDMPRMLEHLHRTGEIDGTPANKLWWIAFMNLKLLRWAKRRRGGFFIFINFYFIFFILFYECLSERSGGLWVRLEWAERRIMS